MEEATVGGAAEEGLLLPAAAAIILLVSVAAPCRRLDSNGDECSVSAAANVFWEPSLDTLLLCIASIALLSCISSCCCWRR